MKFHTTSSAVTGFVLIAATAAWADREIDLAEVPAAALAAAEAAVEGIRITEAEVEEEDGRMVYELEGKAGGKEYEVEVTAEGEVLEVEEDD